jgi:DNA primase
MTTHPSSPAARVYYARVEAYVHKYYAEHPDLIERLLERLGASHLVRQGSSLRCTCPVHRGDNDTAFAVWWDQGVPKYVCHTQCATKGTLTWLLRQKFPGATYIQAVCWLAQFAGLQVQGQTIHISREAMTEDSLDRFLRQVGQQKPGQQKRIIFPPSMVDWSIGNQHGYFHDRQFTPEVLAAYEVGFVPGGTWIYDDPDPAVDRQVGWFVDRCSVPWRNLEGALVGFSGRRVDDATHIKWKTLVGTDRAGTVYGLHLADCRAAIRQTRTLVLVEGFGDVWRGWMHNCRNIGCVGGVHITEQQMQVISRFNVSRIIVFYDGDATGQTTSRAMAKRLQCLAPVYLATPPAERDPGDLMQREQFWLPLVQATLYRGEKR